MSDPTARPPADTTTEARIAAAFGALATTEVPASAPRPTQGPRPPVRDDRSRRRRFGLASGGVLVAAAAVTVAVLVGGEVNDARRAPTAPPATGGSVVTTAPGTSAPATTPPPSSPTPTRTTPGSSTPETPAGPSAAQVEQAFTAATAATRSTVVTVPGGYEGADLDAGTIRFWRSTDGTSWDVDGSSSYPSDVRGDRQTLYTAVIRSAARLTGMDHASYLVYGDAFTGDATGFVIVYADGPDGWGAVKAGSDGNLHPSGAPVDPADQIGLMRDGSLEGGLLNTVDCTIPTSGPLNDCTQGNRVDKSWRWDGSQFVLAN